MEQHKKSGKTFKIIIDHKPHEWEEPCITGAQLKELAGVDPSYGVWLEQPGKEEDPEIGDYDKVNLEEPGVERFFTGIKETTPGLSFLPTKDREYLNKKGIAHEEIRESTQKAVVFKQFPTQNDSLSAVEADVLVLLPGGYSDVGPDMFYTNPWIKITASNQYPQAADNAHDFAGIRWQRWSRHMNMWRPGIDGIWTFIKRIETAFKQAGQ